MGRGWIEFGKRWVKRLAEGTGKLQVGKREVGKGRGSAKRWGYGDER